MFVYTSEYKLVQIKLSLMTLLSFKMLRLSQQIQPFYQPHEETVVSYHTALNA